jgi:hypothetical protein
VARTPNTRVARGKATIEIEGLAEIQRGLGNYSRRVEGILRNALKGRWGQELIGALYAAMARSSDTGYSRGLLRTAGINVNKDGDVEVGAAGDAFDKKHPYHSRANVFSIMTWLESGVESHRIPKNPNKRVAFNGRVLRSVDHPGFRARRPMGSTLRTRGRDLERVVMSELAKQLEVEMRRAGARKAA